MASSGNESSVSFLGLFSLRVMKRDDLFLYTSYYKNIPFVMREVKKGLKVRVRRKEAAGLDSHQTSSGRAPIPSSRGSLLLS